MNTKHDSILGVVLNDTYLVTELLGSGGMGSVYRAQHVRLPRPFAIKVLHEAVDTSSEMYVRFRHEAEISSSLRHEHIVEVVDFNVTPFRQPYIVMEFLEGEDLSQRLQRTGKLNLSQATSIVRQVCSALSAVHERGIVHRDLKPQNLFLCRRGTRDDFLKIVDFGISKIQGSQSVVTSEHAMIGTPFYMAPEQIQGSSGDVDHRTDCFAVGVIIYEMLAGRPPFVGQNVASVLYKIIQQDPPSLRSLDAQVPASVEAVVNRALAKNKEERFQSVQQFSSSLLQAVRSASSIKPSTIDFVEEPTDEDWSPPPPARRSVEFEIPAPPPPAPPDLNTTPPSPASIAAAFGSSTRQPGPQPLVPSTQEQAKVTTMSGAASEMPGPTTAVTVGTQKRSSWLAVVSGSMGALALGSLVTWAILRGDPDKSRHRPRPGTGRPAAAVQPPPDGAVGKRDDGSKAASPRPDRVIVRLLNLPSSARCKAGDTISQGNLLVLPRSGQKVTIVCRGPGFQEYAAGLVPLKDIDLTIQMSPADQPKSGAAHTPRKTAATVARRSRVASTVRKVPPSSVRPRRPRPSPRPGTVQRVKARKGGKPAASDVLDDDSLID